MNRDECDRESDSVEFGLVCCMVGLVFAAIGAYFLNRVNRAL